MQYGISNLSIIPVRSEPSEKSEMVTQILFGEHFEIRDEIQGWINIRLARDGYEGWIDRKMIIPLSYDVFKKTGSSPFAVCRDVISVMPFAYDQNLILVAGSTLPLWRPYLREFTINKQNYKFPGNVFYGKRKNLRDLIVRQSLNYINTPYLWGGRTPFGIDCSGLSQIVYKMAGIHIPRDAREQAKLGRASGLFEDSKPGDLAFFENNEGNIVHVGIILQKNKIIHAHGKVRIDTLDQHGIYNEDLKRFTHKLRVIKKIIFDDETD